MPDKADERVIAEWLGYKWVVPKNKYYDPQWEGAKGECVRVEFSVNANLWFGDEGIFKKMVRSEELRTRYFTLLRLFTPNGSAITGLLDGPEAWTHALAQAIREMKGGG